MKLIDLSVTIANGSPTERAVQMPVANFCDAVAVVYCGEIVEKGMLEDIFDPEKKHHPYLVGLLNSIPKLTEEADRLVPISGMMPDPTELPEGCKFHPRCPHCMEICRTTAPLVTQDGTHLLKCHLFNGENPMASAPV